VLSCSLIILIWGYMIIKVEVVMRTTIDLGQVYSI